MIKIKHKSSIVIFVLICILLFSVLSLTVTAFIVYNKKQKVLNNNIEVVSFDYIRKWENRYNNESYDLNDFKDLYDWVSAGAFMSVYERYSEFEINSLDDWKMFCLISNVPLMIQGYYYYYNIDPKYYGTDYYLAPHLTGDFAGKTVRLTNDIDFSGVTPTTKQYNSSKDPYALFPMLHICNNGARNFDFLDPTLILSGFAGTFDGQGYSMKNIDWNVPLNMRTAFFYSLLGTVKNVCFENIKLSVTYQTSSVGCYGFGVVADELVVSNNNNPAITSCIMDNISVTVNTTAYVSCFVYRGDAWVRNCVLTGNVEIYSNVGNYQFHIFSSEKSSNIFCIYIPLSKMGCDFCSTCTGTVHHDYETLKDELNSYSKEEASKQDFNSWWIEGDFIYLKAFFNVSTATVNDGTSTRLYNYVNLYKHNYTTITGYRAGIWVDNSDCLTSDFWKIPPKSNLCHPEFIGWDDSGNTYTAQFTSQQVRISFACYINGKAVDGMRKTFSVKCCRVTPRVKEYYQNGAVKSIQILCDGQDIEISTAGTPYVIDTSCFKDIRKQVHANELVGTFKITLKYKYYALDFD